MQGKIAEEEVQERTKADVVLTNRLQVAEKVAEDLQKVPGNAGPPILSLEKEKVRRAVEEVRTLKVLSKEEDQKNNLS